MQAMSDKLYQRVRPTTWDELRGDKTLRTRIENKFKDLDKCSRFHLFTGPSGTGKTTLARLISKTVLGAPDICIKEISGTDDRGIDAMRALVSDAEMPPVMGKYKVYILDEVQGLTADAKQCLLKPLEDTPSHAWFFLCTSEPDKCLMGKVGDAMRTRATIWALKPLPDSEIKELVIDAANKENLQLSNELLESIVKNAGGSARQALVWLDQGMVTKATDDNGDVNLGRTLLNALAGDFNPNSGRSVWAPVAAALKELKATGKEPESCRRAVLAYMRAVVLNGGALSYPAACILDEFSSHTTYDSQFDGLVSMCANVVMKYRRY